MTIVSVVGARPQFVKAAALSRAIRREHTEILIHTGQHYDPSMSQVFFEQLEIPHPDVNLEVGSAAHAVQTAEIMVRIEPWLLTHAPDWVVVYGDTNSTLAAALVAVKLGLRIVHVEAGVRSFDRRMPEEVNRVLVDRLASLLLCPSASAVDNLSREGIRDGVHMVGDVMADVIARLGTSGHDNGLLERLGVRQGQYVVATVHRPENTDDAARLSAILSALEQVGEPTIFRVHPRTRSRLAQVDGALDRLARAQVTVMDPVGYFDMLRLVRDARLLLTDSGGLQKEAYWLGVPCITLRDQTEWTETVEAGWNVIVGADPSRILAAVRGFVPPAARPPLYGDGHAAERAVSLLSQPA